MFGVEESCRRWFAIILRICWSVPLEKDQKCTTFWQRALVLLLVEWIIATRFIWRNWINFFLTNISLFMFTACMHSIIAYTQTWTQLQTKSITSVIVIFQYQHYFSQYVVESEKKLVIFCVDFAGRVLAMSCLNVFCVITVKRCVLSRKHAGESNKC